MFRGCVFVLVLLAVRAFGSDALIVRNSNLRPQPSTTRKPIRLLQSGTHVDVIDDSLREGYVKVKTVRGGARMGLAGQPVVQNDGKSYFCKGTRSAGRAGRDLSESEVHPRRYRLASDLTKRTGDNLRFRLDIEGAATRVGDEPDKGRPDAEVSNPELQGSFSSTGGMGGNIRVVVVSNQNQVMYDSGRTNTGTVHLKSAARTIRRCAG